MALVQYSSSSSSDSSSSSSPSKTATQPPKRKRPISPKATPPPLPETFHDLYASTARVSNRDDPTLHGGRQRITPHVEGNWPTHVYIECMSSLFAPFPTRISIKENKRLRKGGHPSTEHSSRLNAILSTLNKPSNTEAPKIHSLLSSDLGASLPLHISLSRPITLQTDQRDAFTRALTSQIGKADLHPFSVSASKLSFVANYEKTRWFLVLQLDRAPQDSLNKLLRISNTVAQSFGQLPLYAEVQAREPVKRRRGRGGHLTQSERKEVLRSDDGDMSSQFHVSIGWMLEAPEQGLRDKLDEASHGLKGMQVPVQAVKVKIGNTVTSITLESKVDSSNGIIEKCYPCVCVNSALQR